MNAQASFREGRRGQEAGTDSDQLLLTAWHLTSARPRVLLMRPGPGCEWPHFADEKTEVEALAQRHAHRQGWDSNPDVPGISLMLSPSSGAALVAVSLEDTGENATWQE